MKEKKLLTLLIGILFLVTLALGCDKTEKPASGASITLTDMKGREISLKEPASRVVALTAADCEILYAIGAGETLVGRGEFCDYPAEVLEVPAVQSGSETNLEQIIDLEPQLILMSTMAQSKDQLGALEDAGIQVVVSEANDIEGTYTAITMIGTLMGREAEAQSVIDSMKETLGEVTALADQLSGKSIYFEVSPLEWGLWTAGEETFMDEIAGMIGLENSFSDVTGWKEISEEQVLERNPDYILTIAMYFGEGPEPVEEILGRPGWEKIKAVENGALLNLPDNELSRPGPRLAEGAKILFDFIQDLEEALDKAA